MLVVSATLLAPPVVAVELAQANSNGVGSANGVKGASAVTSEPNEQAPIPESSTRSRARLLGDTSFLLPGAHYVGWVPARKGGEAASGGGFELSFARHFGDGSTVMGVLAQAERLDRWRVGLGFEAGYELVGLELSAVRELQEHDRWSSQWSLQVAPYVSFGFVNLSARWVIALSRRGAPDAPGDGAMLVIGFKIPLRLSHPPEP